MQQPNYLLEIKKFYDWLETNQISKSAIALWHGLMHVANKTMWDERFTVAISVLESKTGFKRSELNDARNLLAQKGRITWRSRGGNNCAEYSICFFETENLEKRASKTEASVHNTDTNTTTNPTQTPPQTGTISKPNAFSTKPEHLPDDKSSGLSENFSKQAEIFEKDPQSKNNSESREEKRKKSCAKKKKKEKRVARHWSALVGMWFEFCIENLKKGKPRFDSTEGGQLSRILIGLEDKAIEENYDWTEENAKAWFGHFLALAWRDKWLPQNWLLLNLDKQFNKIIASDVAVSNAGAPPQNGNTSPPANKPGIVEKNMNVLAQFKETMNNFYQNQGENEQSNQSQEAGNYAFSAAGESA